MGVQGVRSWVVGGGDFAACLWQMSDCWQVGCCCCCWLIQEARFVELIGGRMKMTEPGSRGSQSQSYRTDTWRRQRLGGDVMGAVQSGVQGGREGGGGGDIHRPSFQQPSLSPHYPSHRLISLHCMALLGH